MRRGVLPTAALVAGVALVSCFEISAPPRGLSSISPIQAAWPSVVVGDALRDSLGDTAALVVEAYGGNGEPVTDAEVRFIVLDRGLHVTAAGVVVGDSIRTSKARIVAQVSRAGEVLQTPESGDRALGIDVVPLPDSVAPIPAETTFATKPIVIADPDPILSDQIVVKVMHKGTATEQPQAVRSWVVRYEILDWPDGVEDRRTALFVADTAKVAVLDTTDANGEASRTISLQRALLESTRLDTVIVRATVRRIGTANETRTILFRLPFGAQ